MRYKLKDYQVDAAQAVLNELEIARRAFHEQDRLSSFALSATTGSGKTVIATAVIEALFEGSDELEFDRDDSAVVLWMTYDPSLNEQTRHRMIEASDGLTLANLVPIGNGFDQERLEAGHVYFMNFQKLGSKSTYVKHSDNRAFTLWETVKNTIDDSDLTLYLVLDEAHVGMKAVTSYQDEDGRSTIVHRLINGHGGLPPAPVVWGISATTARFEAAMRAAKATGRAQGISHEVDPTRVQESGLLKDTIVIDSPAEEGEFDTTLLRQAVNEITEATSLWKGYTEEQGIDTVVAPLLVVQVPNNPSNAHLVKLLDVIYESWEDLGPDAVANVFGTHSTLELGKYEVPYVPPQDVQDATHIRVLLAKDAVSTGWDCPRAEVMFSLRPAKDRTHITQLLGRMVRTPLARRIPSDERLNAVTCFLPHFDQKTALDVARQLTGKNGDKELGSDTGGQQKVIVAPVTLTWNEKVPEGIRECLAALPTESKPSSLAKPIRRMLTLAAALSWDGLVESASAKAHSHLYAGLDGQLAENKAAVDERVEAILQAEITRMTGNRRSEEITEDTYETEADERTVDDAFRGAARRLSTAVANGYAKHVALEEDGGEEPDLLYARAKVAALLSIDGVFEAVEARAEKLTKKWLDEFYVDIKHLSDDRRDVYRDIRSQAREPQLLSLEVPDVLIEETVDKDGKPLPTLPLHVLSDGDGNYPTGKLNAWERAVVAKELERPKVRGWYRNPSQATVHSVKVPCRVDGKRWGSVQPDFIFFSEKEDGEFASSIIDPHGTYLGDALGKLRGLASFAERYAGDFLRVDAIAKNKKGDLTLLNLKDPDVRDAVADATNAQDLFEGPVAQSYD